MNESRIKSGMLVRDYKIVTENSAASDAGLELQRPFGERTGVSASLASVRSRKNVVLALEEAIRHACILGSIPARPRFLSEKHAKM
jgi:hypothetical protein